jgi:hypothetical protein
MHPVGTYAKNIYIHNGQELRRYIDTDTYDKIDGSVTFHLANDISVTGSPVYELYGTFDGHGYTINLNVSGDTREAGLFTRNYGVIKNLKLTGSVTGTFDTPLTTGIGAGAVATDNMGTIKRVVSTVTVSATQAGTGNLWVGGIAGTNSGTIEDCSAGGNVQGNKPNTGGNAPEAGGIAGNNESGGSINRCYAYGDVSLTTVTSGSGIVGGIGGWNEGAISNCAALNGKVENGATSLTYQGRIAGYVDSVTGTCTNNHAYADMQIGGQTTAVTGGVANDKNGADIAGATLPASGSETTLWTASGVLDWPAFQTSPASEPLSDSISPWYWHKTIAIPANDVNAAGVAAAYVPALWFE